MPSPTDSLRRASSRPKFRIFSALLSLAGLSSCSVRRMFRPRAAALPLLAIWLVASRAVPAGAQQVPIGDPAANPGPVIVVDDDQHDLSLPLLEMELMAIGPPPELETELRLEPTGENPEPDAALSSLPQVPSAMPAPSIQFDGISAANSSCGCSPADPNAAVGLHHIVQTVNIAFRIYDKSGNSLFGPAAINTIWAGFGGACQTQNAGTPVVLYDQLADRWVISQPTGLSAPYFQCIAVSQTGDPLGAWYRYAFQTSATKINDHPHLGVWPDGYYMTANLFLGSGFSSAGSGAYVFERTKMLAGLPATMQLFELPSTDWGGMLPSDLDGSTPPPAGAANVFVEVVDGAWDPANWPNDELHFHQFHVDWTTPASSTFNQAPIQVAVVPFDGLLCNFGACVPQLGTTQKLSTLSDRLMPSLAYRNFGTHESLVLNHTVDAATDRAAIRWYEIRSPRSNPPIVFQQSTFSPDSRQRWMGSIAMDSRGNMAIGYTASSSIQTPDIRYTGRLAGDALNTLPQGEAVLISSPSSQTGGSRWGDYSDLTLDPRDDCTFWHTNEYANGSWLNWKTRIGAFRFPSCDTLFKDGFELGSTVMWGS